MAPSAVSVVEPVTLVLPIVMLPPEPAEVVRLSVPAVMVPDVESVPPAALSVTLNVPVPTLDA